MRGGLPLYGPLIPANAGTQILKLSGGLDRLSAHGVSHSAIPSGSRHSPG
jgi:hypothetical protein